MKRSHRPPIDWSCILTRAGLLAVLVLVAWIAAGCEHPSDPVEPAHWHTAETLCELNGGISYVKVWKGPRGVSDSIHVKCVNGAVFDGHVVETKRCCEQ